MTHVQYGEKLAEPRKVTASGSRRHRHSLTGSPTHRRARYPRAGGWGASRAACYVTSSTGNFPKLFEYSSGQCLLILHFKVQTKAVISLLASLGTGSHWSSWACSRASPVTNSNFPRPCIARCVLNASLPASTGTLKADAGNSENAD